ncbi:MAG: cytochrome c biogenesis protein ResB [Chloroflexi bacterium]|nr:cytochrome c biogenesis protein ResB [Chloroflexota bacterium]
MTARPPAAAAAARRDDRLARFAERTLRAIGDARLALVLLLLAGATNVVAALLPAGPRGLDGLPYAVLLGAVALSSVAAVAVRAPAAWREWRRPGSVQPGPGALIVFLEPVPDPAAAAERLRAVGYRVTAERRRGRWAVHAVRRGWSRFAGSVAHLAVLVVILGVATGSAFGSEARFTLHPGDQALLDAPRAGFTSAVRLEGFDAEFAPDGRPQRLDTTVTFLRDGQPVEQRLLRVNEPGAFDGYLVHPWTYGPSARVRVTTLGGSPLVDAAVPLPEVRDGVPVGSVELPTIGSSLGLALADARANVLGVSLVGRDGLVDTARLQPGDEVRLGDVQVRLDRFDAWVTLLSRRDPGLGLVFGGAALLCGSLAIAFWMPRRRLTIRPAGAGGRLVLRGERFDRPSEELERLRNALVDRP